MAGLEGVDAGGLILRDGCEDTLCQDLKERREYRFELMREYNFFFF